MHILAPNPLDIARNIFVPSIDGRENAEHQARIALIATLLDDGMYDDLPVHKVCSDLESQANRLPPTRLQLIARGFAEFNFPLQEEITIVPADSVEI